ncbi:MAG: cysteine--tRNA ligase [Chloroflexota bacterium]|nr:cysteine--tRNA ligase [Chloroflexota bacterium]
MRLYDTLSGEACAFESGPEVSMYVCGITPYDTTHLGHAFLYVVFDVLMRHLEASGYTVTYTQNVTDIDDDILRKSAELAMDYRELARRETERFQRDLAALNVRPPDHYPRATQEIDRMVALIGQLVERGHAYEREGNVYFRLSSYASYGALSKLNRAEMLEIAAERGGNPDDPLRDDPLDFQLWQKAAPSEPSWPSPWSDGRPGWHIECSEMALRYLGQPVTIHGGGSDLIFPHHECERAQSESLNPDEPFVRFWVHVGMLRYENEKMSKSLGNLVLVGDLVEEYSPDAIRLALLSHHYRESWEYEHKVLTTAQAWADQLAAALELRSGDGQPLDPSLRAAEYAAALDNDMDIPTAIHELLGLACEMEVGSRAGASIAAAREVLREKGDILGLTFQPTVVNPARQP